MRVQLFYIFNCAERIISLARKCLIFILIVEKLILKLRKLIRYLMQRLQELLDINVILAHLRDIIIFNVKSLRFLTNFLVIFNL